MKLALIVALARNRVIGTQGKLPWHIPEDLKRFKRLTMGHAVLMGRRTYESIGRPLPHRRFVVLSATPVPGVETFASLDAALAILADQERVFVIGGGTLYSALLPKADELYLTLVDRVVDGDTFFPPYEELLASHFRLVHHEDHEGFTFMDYVRIPP